MEHRSFEERLRTALHARFFEMSSALNPAAAIEDVRVWGSYPDVSIAILFRENRRPECLFGFHWGSVRPWYDDDDSFAKEPEGLATLIWANWDELFAPGALPEDCDPTEITWIPEPPQGAEAGPAIARD